MAKLKAATRKKLPASKFCKPKARKYPVHDRSHAANALSRASQHGAKGVKGCVCRKYPSMGSCKKGSRKK